MSSKDWLTVLAHRAGQARMTIPRFHRSAHVLIVDDEPTNRLVESKICQLFGATTECVASGEEALQLCAQNAFDIILMDIRMPLMDGIETSFAIRSLPGAAGRVPIIAVTGDDGQILRRTCYAAGMSTLLPKPITIQALFDAMDAALREGGVPVTSSDAEVSAATG